MSSHGEKFLSLSEIYVHVRLECERVCMINLVDKKIITFSHLDEEDEVS